MAYLNECRFLNKPIGHFKMQILNLPSLKLKLIKGFAYITLALFSAQTLAVEFNAIDTAKSKINFTSKLMGSTINGSFDQFGGVVNFNSDNPEKAKADIWIALASFNAGGDELRDEAQGKEWFNSKIFPRAQFVSETIKKLGANKLEIKGKLTIKNKTQPLTMVAEYQVQGKQMIFNGGFELMRLSYDLGAAAWADTKSVANEVPVKVHLVLNPK
jgi:polyisoprenoid-binding protein YceI